MTDLIHTVTAAAAQLPPEIQKSLVKSVTTLIAGLVDVPAAWLESKSAAIRSETEARRVITEAAGKAVAERFAADPALAERATSYLGHRLLREQKNRESVAAKALNEIAKDPPTADSNGTVDDDWLTSFARVSETRSDDEMQAYFARILAGEIRAPGSFSPTTLDVAAKLTTDMALTFQRFCSASLALSFGPFVFAEPFEGLPGANSLSPLGLPYAVLTQLQDAGLVQTDLNSYYTFPPAIFTIPFEIAGLPYRAQLRDPNAPHPRVGAAPQMKVVNFTRAGRELRRIVHMNPSSLVVERLVEFLQRFDLTLDRPEPAN